MADLIFVSTEQFKKLKEEGKGTYVIDFVGSESILIDTAIIKIYDDPNKIIENGVNK